VLLLVVAFSTSGLIHLPKGDHAATAASLSHEMASVIQVAGGEPCCPEHNGQSHGTTCSTASGCSFCVPLSQASALVAPLHTEAFGLRSEDVHLSRAPTTQFRPPKLFANV
jgi:hypothetical protein